VLRMRIRIHRPGNFLTDTYGTLKVKGSKTPAAHLLTEIIKQVSEFRNLGGEAGIRTLVTGFRP
jgi:hypothetical protein